MEIIDPDGDLVVILNVETKPFAPWPIASEASSPELVEGSDTSPSQSFFQSPESDDNDTGGSSSTGAEQPSPVDGIVEFLVSSKRLCFAVPRFRTMLTGDWTEAKTVHSDGRRHVEMEGFYSDAFKIMMDIIHAKNDIVPRRVNLDLLGKIAVLADDLQCHGAVSVFSEVWIDRLQGEIGPIFYDRNLIIWIFVSYVFRHASTFKKVTSAAILKSIKDMPTLGLPIRIKITGKYPC
jgi:hypothetical protein